MSKKGSKVKAPKGTPLGVKYDNRFIQDNLLFNLADSITDDHERREAVKGLMRGFTSDFWEKMDKAICEYLSNIGIYPEPEIDVFPALPKQGGASTN